MFWYQCEQTAEDTFLGYELDLNVSYAPRPWFKLALGYALFIPATGPGTSGTTLRPTGPTS